MAAAKGAEQFWRLSQPAKSEGQNEADDDGEPIYVGGEFCQAKRPSYLS